MGFSMLSLQDYEFKAVWLKGTSNVVSDALSRIQMVVNAMKVTFDSIKDAQKYDGEIRKLRESGDKSLFEKNGTLYKRGCNTAEQVVLPSALRRAAITDAHVGHCGVRKMISILRDWCWWPNMQESVEDFYIGCSDCQRKLISRQPTNAPLHVSGRDVWTDLVCDFCGPFPNGNQSSLRWTYSPVFSFTAWSTTRPPQTPPSSCSTLSTPMEFLFHSSQTTERRISLTATRRLSR